MRTHSEEMMTLRIGNPQERISPEDIAVTKSCIDLLTKLGYWRTYAFNITSDSVPEREETG